MYIQGTAAKLEIYSELQKKDRHKKEKQRKLHYIILFYSGAEKERREKAGIAIAASRTWIKK